MLFTEHQLRDVIKDVLLEFDYEAAPPPASNDGRPRLKKMTKDDATETIGMIKTIKPEEIQAAAPKVLRSLVNNEALPTGYGKVQTIVANNTLKKNGIIDDIKKWKTSIQEQNKDEYAATKSWLIARLGKQRVLGGIIMALLMPDDMVSSVAQSIGTEVGKGWGGNVGGAASSNAVEVGMKTAAKGTATAAKAVAKAAVGTLITLFSLYSVADFAYRDAASRESLEELVKKTFSVRYGREHGTRFKLTNKQIKVISYS